jgi:hypothetical protein
MNSYIENTLITMILTIAPVVVSVFIHNAFRSAFVSRIFRSKPSRFLYYFFAFFFTPIHEISHLIVAVLFGHKIDKVVLFQRNKSGTLGFVYHRWNSNSLYQSTGNFFIAIAPLIASVLITFFILDSSSVNIGYISFNYESVMYVVGNLSLLEITFISLVGFYCTPSNSDFKNAMAGFGYLGIFLALGTILSMVGFDASKFNLIATFSLGMTGVVCVFSSLFWFVLLLVSLVFKAEVEPKQD